MTEPGPRPGQSPEQRAEELKRRHLEARRRQTQRRRRTRMAVAATVLVVAVVVGLVAARAYGPWGAGPGPAASASPRPAPSASTPDAGTGAGEVASPLPSLKAKTPPATPTGEATPTQAATPAAQSTAEAAGTAAPAFVVSRALSDVRTLEDIGVRAGGSSVEKAGAAYIARRLGEAHVTPEIRTFKLPNGKTSRNVVARFPGSTSKTIILGAHMDSKAPSPGANDNGSGCGALLEIARCLGQRRAYPTVELVFFGTEEMIDANPDHHHYGSRYHVKDMSAGARKNAAGMISVDMIGYGPAFVVRSMGRGPQTMVDLLLQQAKKRGLQMSYLRDPGASGWSDHEAFELAGIPAAWIEWRDDPVYHTAADTSGHVVAAQVGTAGQFVLGVLYGMDAAALERLAR